MAGLAAGWRPGKLLLVLSPVLGLLAFLVLLFPPVRVVRETSRHPHRVGRSRLEGILYACRNYAAEHDGRLPADLYALWPEYVDTLEAFVSPMAEERGLPQPHYALGQGVRLDRPGLWVVAYDRMLASHEGQGRYVALIECAAGDTAAGAAVTGCRVEWWPARREGELQARLAAQAGGVVAAQVSGQSKEEGGP